MLDPNMNKQTFTISYSLICTNKHSQLVIAGILHPELFDYSIYAKGAVILFHHKRGQLVCHSLDEAINQIMKFLLAKV